jgi:putative ABC transport system permease protein
MLTLIKIYSFALIKREPLKVLISFLGLVIGVAIFYAMQTSSQYVYTSFNQKLFDLKGSTPYVVESSLGEIDNQIYPKLRRNRLIKNVTPISQKSLRLKDFGSQKINLMGIDILYLRALADYKDENYSLVAGLALEPEIYLTKDLYQKFLNNNLEQKLCVLSQCFYHIKEITESKLNSSIVLDIAIFQNLFKNNYKVDSYYLTFKNETNLASQISEVLKELPKHISINKMSDSSAYLERVTQAFRVNLNFLASLSLAAALILIYNTAYYICIRRHADIALFLTLGASQKTVKSLIFIEGFVFSASASILGMILGYLLSFVTNQITASTASGIYNSINNTQVSFSFKTALIALIAGISTAQYAIMKANKNINKIDIKSAFSQRISYKPNKTNLKLSSLNFLILALVTICLSNFLEEQSNPYLGFLPAIFAILSSFYLAEIILTIIAKLFTFSSNPNLLIAGAFNREEIQRQKFTIFALSLTLGMFFAVTAMISSFRSTVHSWIQQITPADLYISGSKDLTSSTKNYFSKQDIQLIKTTFKQDLIDAVQSKKIIYDNLPLIVYGIDFEVLKLKPRLSFAIRPDNYLLSLSNENSVFVSESFAKRAKLNVHKDLKITGENFQSKLKVAGIIFDFTSEHGVVYLSQKMFQKLFNSENFETFAIFVNSTAQNSKKILQNNKDLIIQTLKDKQLTIRTNFELQNEVLKIFNQTFAVTYLLELSALIIAALVLAISVLILLVERKSFLLIFFTLGASLRQLKMLIFSELLLICLTTAILSMILGLALALILVYFVNYYFFGWSISFTIPWQPCAYTLSGLFIIAYLVGVMPIHRFLEKSLKHE